MEFDKRAHEDRNAAKPSCEGSSNGQRPLSDTQLGGKSFRPEGGFAHEWNWEEQLGQRVYVDHSDGIAWVRISECPVEKQAALRQWIEDRMMACPIIDGLEPQDAMYVWDYAEFLEEFCR